jgi:4-hydroxy-2-oxoheptanedioate aldolase
MTFRERLGRKGRLLGTFQTLDTPMVTELLGHSGLDFVVLDQEHGPLSAETTLQCCMAADSTDVAAIVRVRQNDAAEIQRALDAGAAGVQVPQVETASAAAEAVEAARFAPEGSRGLSPYVRAGAYTGGDDYPKGENEGTAVILQVEGERGLGNLESILAVDGVDAVFLGPNDISASIGIPGQTHDDRVTSRVASACESARDAGVAVGAFAGDRDLARQWFEAGAEFVELTVETDLLGRAVEDAVADLETATKTDPRPSD